MSPVARVTRTALFLSQILLTTTPVFSQSPSPAAAIASVQISDITEETATVTWNTDIPSSSSVIFIDPGDTNAPINRTTPDQTLVTFHAVSLSRLLPAASYSIYVVSVSNGVVSSTVTSPITFTTLPRQTAPLYRLDTYGPTTVFAGSDLYFGVSSVLLGGAPDHLYFDSVTGLPSSITSHIICRNYEPTDNESNDCLFDSTSQRYYAWTDDSVDTEDNVIRLRTQSYTAPGQYSVTIITEASGSTQTITYSFTVVSLPATPSNSVLAVPTIPGRQDWESAMTALGAKWCVPNQQMAFGYENQVWYYDGGRVYFNLFDYTQNPQWLSCESNILTQYRSDVISNLGALEGWRIFPHGLAMNYWRNEDKLSRTAVNDFVSGDSWVNKSGSPYVGLVRETSYALEAMIKNQQLTGVPDWHVARTVDYLLGDIDCFTRSDPNDSNQSFFDGLLMEALINYYEVNADPRIPPAIKELLDWLWDTQYDVLSHKFRYNSIDQPGWYTSTSNHLIDPAYAWYWSITGDSTYLVRGDDIFSHGLDEDISYSGKIFSQNFRWSPDYVRWRSGVRFSTTSPSFNVSGLHPSAITGLAATPVDSFNERVTWATPSASTEAEIEYGELGYDQSTGIDLTFATAHDVTLTALSPNTTYQYRVRCFDEVGNLTVTAGTFTTLRYTGPTIPSPLLVPAAGTYNSDLTVTLKAATSGVSIMYTTDGTNPTIANGTRYKEPIPLHSNTTVKAAAFATTGAASLPSVGTYVFAGSGSVYSALWGGTSDGTAQFGSGLSTLPAWRLETRFHNLSTRSDQGHQYALELGNAAMIYLDALSGTLYLASQGSYCQADLSGTNDVTIRVQYDSSVVTLQVWDSKTGTLRANTNCNSTSGPMDVSAIELGGIQGTPSFLGATAFVRIYSTAAAGSSIPSALASGGEMVDYEFEDPNAPGFDSSDRHATLAFKGIPTLVPTPSIPPPPPAPSAPAFSLPPGVYSAPQTVTIVADTGTYVRYSVDGTVPSAINGILYTGPITISSTTILRAISFKDGVAPSSVTSAGYDFRSFYHGPQNQPIAVRGRHLVFNTTSN